MAGGDRTRGSYSDSESDGDDSDVGFATIQCWIPSSNVDLQALAAYLKDYIDDAATIRPSPNPNDATRPGYTITAKRTLSVAQVRDIIEDSRAWEKEKLTREYRRDPYGYHESDVWEKRKRIGASVPESRPRRRRRRSPSAPTSPPPPSLEQTQATSRHGSIDNSISYRRTNQDASPVGVAAGVPAPWQQPSIATVADRRHIASSDKDKVQTQFSPRVASPPVSNMARAVASDRHHQDD